MSTKTELILHVGAGKCGSTAIQQGLWRGAEQLRDSGILYHPAANNGHFNYKTLLGGQIRGNNRKATLQAERNATEIKKAVSADSPRYVLFSAESFFDVDPGRLLTLLDELVPGYPRVHVVAYVRCPTEHYVSMVQQQLKGSHRITPPQTYNCPLIGRLLDWRENGRAVRVSVRHFERQKLVGGSAVEDFAEVLKTIVGHHIALPEVDANVSLSAEQMIVLQRFRRVLLSEHAGKLHVRSRAIIRFFQNLNLLYGPVWTRPRLLSEVAARIHDRHQDKLRAMDEHFPELGLGEVCGGKATLGNLTIDENDSVEKILADWDPTVVSTLESVLPQYASNVDSTWARRAGDRLVGLGLSDSALSAYREFLATVGYGQHVRV